jgi:hypothetical protein
MGTAVENQVTVICAAPSALLKTSGPSGRDGRRCQSPDSIKENPWAATENLCASGASIESGDPSVGRVRGGSARGCSERLHPESTTADAAMAATVTVLAM